MIKAGLTIHLNLQNISIEIWFISTLKQKPEIIPKIHVVPLVGRHSINIYFCEIAQPVVCVIYYVEMGAAQNTLSDSHLLTILKSHPSNYINTTRESFVTTFQSVFSPQTSVRWRNIHAGWVSEVEKQIKWETLW